MSNKKEYNAQYYIKNRVRILKYKKQWYIENGEGNKEKKRENDERYRRKNAEKLRERKRQWNKNNRKKINYHFRDRSKTDLRYNLDRRMKTALRIALKGNKAGRHWEDLVGYTLDDLIKRLKKTMPKGYTWQYFLEGRLHIDHKIPISAFNYTKPEHTDFKKCWALRNLRLLPAKENWRKSNKLQKPFQPSLKIIY